MAGIWFFHIQQSWFPHFPLYKCLLHLQGTHLLLKHFQNFPFFSKLPFSRNPPKSPNVFSFLEFSLCLPFLSFFLPCFLLLPESEHFLFPSFLPSTNMDTSPDIKPTITPRWDLLKTTHLWRTFYHQRPSLSLLCPILQMTLLKFLTPFLQPTTSSQV